MRVLLVEDEKNLSAAVCKFLKRENIVADPVYTGPDGLPASTLEAYGVERQLFAFSYAEGTGPDGRFQVFVNVFGIQSVHTDDHVFVCGTLVFDQMIDE